MFKGSLESCLWGGNRVCVLSGEGHRHSHGPKPETRPLKPQYPVKLQLQGSQSKLRDQVLSKEAIVQNQAWACFATAAIGLSSPCA